MRLRGHCLCGEIAFVVEHPPFEVTHCYCSMCRRHSGAALQTFAAFPTEAILWTGRPATFRSSTWATRGFCSRCGSSLFLDYDDQADTTWLTAGAFDDPDRLTPGLHWCLEDRVRWMPYDPNLPDG